MPRLIEVDDPSCCAAGLTVETGDLLLFAASGGLSRSGRDVLAPLGSFMRAVAGTDGGVFTPMGAPNATLFQALRPGSATIEVIAGDPFHAPRGTIITVVVQPPVAPLSSGT